MVKIRSNVFPSSVHTVSVKEDDTYGGAHEYTFQNCEGFDPEKKDAIYVDSTQTIQFVKMEIDGSMTPGLQSEQLIYALIDRTKKLNDKFPCPENMLAIRSLQTALYWFQERVQDRMERQVMGDLKQ